MDSKLSATKSENKEIEGSKTSAEVSLAQNQKEEEPKLRPKHKQFLINYIDVNSKNTFGNASKSYAKVYTDNRFSEFSASRLLSNVKSRHWLTWYYNKNIPTKEQFTSELRDLSKGDIKVSDKTRIYELVGKVLGFTAPENVNNTLNVLSFDDILMSKLSKYTQDIDI